MERAAMIAEIRAYYNKVLSDNTFVYPEQAAYNAADNCAVWCVMNKYNIGSTYDLTQEMQIERRSLLIEAIGKTEFDCEPVGELEGIENDILYVSDSDDLVKVDINDLPDYQGQKQEAEEESSLYPADGTKYYYISAYAQVIQSTFVEGCEVDIYIFDIGNGFLTQEEAEFELERRKVIAKMKLYAEPIPVKWNCINKHWNINYSFLSEIVYITNSVSCIWGELYFSSEEQARKAIDAVGEENVKKYYLGVLE